jgi:hypothetical protein
MPLTALSFRIENQSARDSRRLSWIKSLLKSRLESLAVQRFTLIFLVLSAPSLAAATTEMVCDTAARQVAQETNVPLSVLRSITRTETGRARGGQLQPWPWTVNMEGKGHWFETEDAARAYVFKEFRRGARSFDVGCFQINFKWHGENFRSIDQMFDPIENARYAARFLTRLHSETGDWSRAAGAFHSRTPKYAEKYRARFDNIRKSMADVPNPMPRMASIQSTPPLIRTRNSFPLLQQTQARRSIGSLVPLGRSAGRSLLGLGTNGS